MGAHRSFGVIEILRDDLHRTVLRRCDRGWRGNRWGGRCSAKRVIVRGRRVTLIGPGLASVAGPKSMGRVRTDSGGGIRGVGRSCIGGRRHHAAACQYPDMRNAVGADLAQLRVIFSLYERYDSAIKTKALQEELSARLREELDYTLEARHAKLYGYILRGEKNVRVAEVVDELSTDRLLTAGWLEGRSILTFKEADQTVRNRLALNMFRTWYVPLYHYGVVHGDPHLGNYTVREDESHQPARFRLRAGFPRRLYRRRHRALPRAAVENDEARGRRRVRKLGLHGVLTGSRSRR